MFANLIILFNKAKSLYLFINFTYHLNLKYPFGINKKGLTHFSQSLCSGCHPWRVSH